MKCEKHNSEMVYHPGLKRHMCNWCNIDSIPIDNNANKPKKRGLLKRIFKRA